MIRSAKSPQGEWLIWRLIRQALTKHFYAVHLRDWTGHGSHGNSTEAHGASDATGNASRSPLPTIFYPNHSNWFDGYLCMALARALKQNPYLMMEEKNLARYRFFTWAGVFGVDRDDARAALGSLEYAAELLHAPPRDSRPKCLFIFPQGTMAPNDRRPLEFFSGAARLALRVAKSQPVRLVPVAFKYEYLQEQKPEAFISLGPALILGQTGEPLSTPRALNAMMGAALTAELDALRADITAEHFNDFTTILRGKGGIDRIFDRAMSRGRRESRRLTRTAQESNHT